MKFNYILMKFEIHTQKTAFYNAVDKGNVEVIKLLLSYDKIDTNILNINNYFFSANSNIKFLNII